MMKTIQSLKTRRGKKQNEQKIHVKESRKGQEVGRRHRHLAKENAQPPEEGHIHPRSQQPLKVISLHIECLHRPFSTYLGLTQIPQLDPALSLQHPNWEITQFFRDFQALWGHSAFSASVDFFTILLSQKRYLNIVSQNDTSAILVERFQGERVNKKCDQ